MSKPRTGTVNWGGTKFRALEKFERVKHAGQFVMLALETHPRVAQGQLLVAKESEVTWDAESSEGQQD